jgi:hypothetical protein
MHLTRKPLIRYGLLPAWLLSAWCHPLSAADTPPMYHPVLFTQQQQSAPPTTQSGSDEQPLSDEQAPTMSDQVIREVLEPLSRGVQTQNIQMILSIFDNQELNGYADLQGQLRAFFHQYSEVNFRYQLLQVTSDQGRGSATADLDMDALPYEVTQTPSRRSVQMRFQLKLGPKGWKVTGFSPSNFFNLGFSRADTQ